MAEERVAIVTGANRGIGFETCRQLAERGLTVVLTSLDADKGRAAAEELKVDHQVLNVTDPASAKAVADYVGGRYGRLDVLVNNAGILLDGPGGSLLTTDPQLIRDSIETNTLGTVRCCQALVPLMQKNGYGRIVNVSTGMAALRNMNSGFPSYRISKTALSAVTRILAEELKGTNIKVNAVCPGHVKTDMGGPDAPRSVDEAVDTIVWLATLRADGPTGGFFRDCKAIEW